MPEMCLWGRRKNGGEGGSWNEKMYELKINIFINTTDTKNKKQQILYNNKLCKKNTLIWKVQMTGKWIM